MISLIVAMTPNGVIGIDGKLPWHLPDDLKNFRNLTTGNIVVMGRKTYDSILDRGMSHLPNRINIVITSNPSRYLGQADVALNPNVIFVTSLEQAIEIGNGFGKEVFIIGGASIYEQAFPLVDKAYLSILKGCCDGDAYFPDVDWYDWRKVSDEDRGDYILRIMEKVDNKQ